MAESNTSVLANPQNLQQWLGVLEGLFPSSQQINSSSQSTIQNSSAADNPLMLMIQQLMGQMGQGVGSPQMQALLAPIFAQLRDVALPQIQGLANSGGGVYNSSTQKLLAGDALARATAQGGSLVVGQQNEMQKQLANLLNILAQSTRTTNQAQQGAQNSQRGGQAGNAAKLGAATGAAAAAAKAIKKAMARSSAQQNGQGRSDDTDDTSGLKYGSAAEEERGESVSGNYGEDRGMEYNSWDSGNEVLDSIWDMFGGNNAVDFEGNWDETGESVSGFWGGFGDSEGTGESVSGFWGGESGSGGSGFEGEPEFEDLGENF